MRMSDSDNPYASPRSDLAMPTPGPSARHNTDGLWRDGSLLVIRIGRLGGVPNRCVKCNATDNCEFVTLHLGYHHPAIYLTLLLTPFVYFPVRRAVGVNFATPVVYCQRHRSQNKLGEFTLGMAFLWPFLFALGLGIILAILEPPGAAWPVRRQRHPCVCDSDLGVVYRFGSQVLPPAAG